MTRNGSGNCLICFRPLAEREQTYHVTCGRRLFGTKKIPSLPYQLKDIEDLAGEEVNRRIAITGVQPKISVDFPTRRSAGVPRLTIVGLWGRFILKPPHRDYPFMPELEAATMNLADACGISTALHGLIRFESGELAYLSRRFDRADERKLAQEDFCQLTGKLTEGKYHSSMEKAGKVILRWATNPGLDAIRFLELAVFSFLTGNSDMHLKNFSLLTGERKIVGLSPAYDLLPTQLLLPSDREEIGLPMNGKKSGLTRRDFVALGRTLSIQDKAIENTIERITDALAEASGHIENTPLPGDLQSRYTDLIRERVRRLST